jgi:hypothetical protein
MIKKLRNQPYAPKREQEEEKKTLFHFCGMNKARE